MQCKDIPDRPILQYLVNRPGVWCTRWPDGAAGFNVTECMPAETPEKLVLAKMRQLIRRKLVDGCGCGCRGDFVITDKGIAYLQGKEADA